MVRYVAIWDLIAGQGTTFHVLTLNQVANVSNQSNHNNTDLPAATERLQYWPLQISTSWIQLSLSLSASNRESAAIPVCYLHQGTTDLYHGGQCGNAREISKVGLLITISSIDLFSADATS